jgi:PIN domain nuclease of toxin-antitoxin system
LILLDTHVLLWFAAEDPKLGRRTSRLVDRALRGEGVGVSAFSFWEVGMLVAKGRLRASPEELRSATLKNGVVEIPVDGRVAIAASALAGFHGDPADRLIAASAIHAGARLVTADEAMLAWRGALRTHDARS